MNIILSCSACGFEAVGSSEKELMNKIVMWNHVKRAHAETAEYVMRTSQMVPSDLYDVRQAFPVTAAA